MADQPPELPSDVATGDKYDAIAEGLLRQIPGARSIFMFVVGNDKKSTGMSFVAEDDAYPVVRASLPSLLRGLADAVEYANKNGTTKSSLITARN